MKQIIVFATLSLLAAIAHAFETRPYTAAALAEAQAAGKPVALQFHATWCPTCRAQDKVFNRFKREPGLDLTLLVADYDAETDLKQKLGVRIQSTIIVYRGSVEKARVAGETDPDKLRAALKAAL